MSEKVHSKDVEWLRNCGWQVILMDGPAMDGGGNSLIRGTDRLRDKIVLSD